MNSNSFNICPHCGNSNSLNARFCSRCGTQLKVPEEVVVCRTCGTRNSPMANFCRNCGSQLKVGEQTKICPKCRKEVPVDSNVCECGYSFATITTVAPDKKGKPVDVRADKKSKDKATPRVTSNKGGRGFAIVALVFVLLFAYVCAAPASLRPAFLSGFDKGFVNFSADSQTYMYEYVFGTVNNVIGAITSPSEGGMFASIMGALGTSLAQQIISIMTVIFALCIAIHLLVCIIRIFSGKRSKRGNGFYLVLAILSTIATALVFLPNFFGAGFLGGFLDLFLLAEGVTIGWVLFAIPLYFWFFALYSVIAKAKTIKEHVA